MDIPFQKYGHAIDRCSVILLMALSLLSIYAYYSTPPLIPIIFNSDGSIKSFGAHWVFITFPLIALLLFITIRWLIQYLFERPTLKRSEKLITLSQLSVLFIKVIKCLVLFSLFCIVLGLLLYAQGYQILFGFGFKMFFIILFSIPVVAYLYIVQKI